MRLVGDFGIAGGEFTNTATQKNIDAFSGKALGEQRNDNDSMALEEDPQRIISNLVGHAELLNATARFDKLSFNVPGAAAEMHGTYNLESEVIELHGTLRTDAELSKMTNGVKSVLLKPLDVFFKRNHAGAVVPIHLIGTYHNPQPGLDLPLK